MRKQAAKENIELDAVSLTEGNNYSSQTLATLWLTKNISDENAKELRNALPKLRQWISLKLVDDCAQGILLY